MHEGARVANCEHPSMLVPFHIGFNAGAAAMGEINARSLANISELMLEAAGRQLIARAEDPPPTVAPPPQFNRDADREDLREIWNFWNTRATLSDMMDFRALLLNLGAASRANDE